MAPQPGSADAGAKRPASDQLQSKQKLGKYSIIRKLGSGGMGTVFLALDEELKRTVALKVLPRERAENPTLVRRFKSEGKAAAVLRHDHIVTVYEAGQADGYLYIALEFVDGTDVHNLIVKRGIVPVKRSIEMIRQVAEALDHAHAQNIVHRDIKPANLLVRKDGVVKLTDLGLARSIDETAESGITRAGTTVGTVDYMSPEQARNSKSADVRSDIYSLGCTWYQMLTGSVPFPEGSLTNKLHAHSTQSPPDPRTLNERVPEGIVAVLHRMLAKRPEDRYQTPAELLADLNHPGIDSTVVSEHVLEALAGGEDDHHSRPSAKPSAPVPPPDGIRDKSTGLPERKQRDFTAAKYLALATLVFAIFGGLWWLISSVGNSFNSPDVAQNPFAPNRSQQMAEATDGTDFAGASGSAGEGGNAVQGGTSHSGNSSSSDGRSGNGDPGNDGRPRTIPSGDGGAAPSRGSQPTVTSRDGGNVVVGGQPGSTVAGSPAGQPGATASGMMRTGSPGGADNPGQPLSVAAVTGSRTILRVGTAGPTTSATPGSPTPAGSVQVAFHVGRSAPADGKMPSLDAAVASIPRQGAVIELHGPGPFFLTGRDWPVMEQTELLGSGEAPSIVVVLPRQDGSPAPLVHVGAGSLSLKGIHLVVNSDQFPDQSSRQVVAVEQGDLLVEDCSAEVLGDAANPTRVFAVNGSSRRTIDGFEGSKLALNRVVVRGTAATAMAAGGGVQECACIESLLISGAAPAIALADGFDFATGQPSSVGSLPQRNIQILKSTLVSHLTAIRCQTQAAPNQLPPTLIESVQSVIACDIQSADRRMFELIGWPQSLNRGPRDPRFPSLSFEVENSLLLGWTNYIALADANPPLPPVTDVDDWQRLWKKNADTQQFQAETWPVSSSSTDGMNSLEPYSTTSLAAVTNVPHAATAGCSIAELTVPATREVTRGIAFARRPQVVPYVVQRPATAQTFDVVMDGKTDLADVIRDKNPPDGSLIRLIGSGDHRCSPIRLIGRSLRIEFIPTNGPRLTLTPILGRSKSPAADADSQALFTVSGGSLELVNARFKFPSSRSSRNPACLIDVKDGSFVIDGCIVEGPLLPGTGWQGAIRWGQTDKPADADEAPAIGQIHNSYLFGLGTLLDLDLRGQSLIVDNSLCVALDRLARLKLGPTATDHQGQVSVSGSTFSTVNEFFVIDGQPSTDGLPRLEMYVTDTIFADAVLPRSTEAGSQAVLTVSPSLSADGQMEWWSESNAYAPSVSVFLQIEGNPDPAVADANAWQERWGAENIGRSLVGTAAEGIFAPFPTAAHIEPKTFVVQENSPAARWGTHGGSIGVDMSRLGRSDVAIPLPGPKTSPQRPNKPKF